MGHADHVVQGKQEVIVRISISTSIDTVDGAAKAALLKDTEELTAVETIGVAGQDLSLTNPIAYCETGRQLRVPSDITELVYIYADDESYRDVVELVEHLAKKNAEPTEAKALALSILQPKTS